MVFDVDGEVLANAEDGDLLYVLIGLVALEVVVVVVVILEDLAMELLVISIGAVAARVKSPCSASN